MKNILIFLLVCTIFLSWCIIKRDKIPFHVPDYKVEKGIYKPSKLYNNCSFLFGCPKKNIKIKWYITEIEWEWWNSLTISDNKESITFWLGINDEAESFLKKYWLNRGLVYLATVNVVANKSCPWGGECHIYLGIIPPKDIIINKKIWCSVYDEIADNYKLDETTNICYITKSEVQSLIIKNYCNQENCITSIIRNKIPSTNNLYEWTVEINKDGEYYTCIVNEKKYSCKKK